MHSTTTPRLESPPAVGRRLSTALGLVAHGHPAGARRLLRMGVLARAFPEVITPLPDRHT